MPCSAVRPCVTNDPLRARAAFQLARARQVFEVSDRLPECQELVQPAQRATKQDPRALMRAHGRGASLDESRQLSVMMAAQIRGALAHSAKRASGRREAEGP